jgi:hypothetical protein
VNEAHCYIKHKGKSVIEYGSRGVLWPVSPQSLSQAIKVNVLSFSQRKYCRTDGLVLIDEWCVCGVANMCLKYSISTLQMRMTTFAK